jgi:hypothetical protein
VFLVPGRSAARKCPLTRTELAVGRASSMSSLFQGEAQQGSSRRQEQSKQLEERLLCVPCSRETEHSGGVPTDKNRSSSWKSSFNVFHVPGRRSPAGGVPPTRTEQAAGRAASMCFMFQETDPSREVSADKNRASSWKSGFNVFLVPGS